MDPTYKKGTGRLATDRYDFQSHVDGTDFRQNANTIDLSPPVTVGISNKNTVQEAVEALAAIAYPPTLSDATTTSKGIIKLDGDLGGGIVGTADLPRVTGLYGKTISSSVSGVLNTGTILFWDGYAWTPTSMTLSANNVFTWSGTSWTNSAIGGDISGTISALSVDKIKGYGLNFSTIPASGDLLNYNGTDWVPIAPGSLALAGDVVGTLSANTIQQITGDGGGEVDFISNIINLNENSGTNTTIKFKNSINIALPGLANILTIQGQENTNGSGKGGAIAIIAGSNTASATGSGGVIGIDGGLGYYDGGRITITGGIGQNNNGGLVRLLGGLGQIDGGNAELISGSGANGSGGIAQIVSGSGDINGGEINISAGDGYSGSGGTINIIPGKTTGGTNNGLIKLYYNDNTLIPNYQELVTVGAAYQTSFVGLGTPLVPLTDIDATNPATNVVYIGTGSEPGVNPASYGAALPGAFLYAKSGKLFVYEGEPTGSPEPLNFQIKPPYIERQYISFDGATPASVTLPNGYNVVSGTDLTFSSRLKQNDEIVIKLYAAMTCATTLSVGSVQFKIGNPPASIPITYYITPASISGTHFISIDIVYKLPADFLTGLTLQINAYSAFAAIDTVDFQLLTFEAMAIRP